MKMTSHQQTTSFGLYIKSRREEVGLSLRQCAKKLSISATYLSDIEHGKRPAPSDTKLSRLARVLHLNAKDKENFIDLAAATHPGTVAPDLTQYLTNTPNARTALRTAQHKGLSDQHWSDIITYITRM